MLAGFFKFDFLYTFLMNNSNLSISIGEHKEALLHKKNLIAVFKDTVALFPKKTAIWFQESAITYWELDIKSNGFAHTLKKLNVNQGDIIGLYLSRGIDLFIAQLGILKAGASYIPFDIETPTERVATILTEAKSNFCVTDKYIAENIHNIGVEHGEEDVSEINLANAEANAHIIFTSGSTGKPKGIPIKHYQIAHFIQSENDILKITSNDIVYQGFSISFDMWFEEVWISYLCGASMVVADEITSKSFDQLSSFLSRHYVTVLHAVPSLLAFIENTIPTLRLINSGGEACNDNVIRKWCGKQITFYNSYGPTETTVTTTIGKMELGNPIHVGTPLPNYAVAIVNEKLEPVPLGEVGELVVSGIGVSEGYFNNNTLTQKSFLDKPISLEKMYGDRIYLTGDLGYINTDGNIVVNGRKDNQVKIRGYRVELGEIESIINAYEGVSNAVVLKKEILGIDQLVAYYELSEDKEDVVNTNHLKALIQEKLPNYMMPSQFIKVPSFNRLASGKIDRKNIPLSATKGEATAPIHDLSNDSFSTKIYALLSTFFPGQAINASSDFFNDLGGHSMLAAVFVSEVRSKMDLNDISIYDIYQKRTVGEIISFWGDKKAAINKATTEPFIVPSKLNYYICGVFQIAALFVIFGLVAAQIFIPYLMYYIVANEVGGIAFPILSAIFSFIIIPPIIFLIIILIKRVFIGKLKAGNYPLWGYTYFKWWFFKRLISIVPSDTLSNTPLYNYFLQSIGIKTAANAQLNKFEFGVSDLIKIGSNVTISANVALNNAKVENGFLQLSAITIADNGYIGTGSIINGGCHIGENGTLKDLSSIGSKQHIQKNEIWEGSPAKLVDLDTEHIYNNENANLITSKYQLTFVALILLIPIIVILPLIPTILGLHYLDENADWYSFYYLSSTPFFSLIYILLFIAEVVLITNLLNRSIQIGTHSIYSATYVKKWFADQLFALLLLVIKPIFATVYINSIYRLLGAKVGANTEISNASNVSHHLLEIGDDSFIADVAVIGESDIKNQQLILKKTIIGNRVFIGNSAIIPQGLNLGNNKLIGVLSIPPSQEQLDKVETDWFGSPAIQLPKRQINMEFPEALTFNPSRYRKFFRGVVEFIRILIPQSLVLCLSILFIAYGHDLITEHSVLFTFVCFPIYYFGIVALPAFIFTFLFKWIIIGKYKKTQIPMWTPMVWFTEAITSIYESLAVPYLLEFLQGTMFLPFFLRLLGVKIGKQVFMDTTDVTEFDLVSIGDYTCLNYDSGPQTHLFEDRIMKMGPVVIGERVTVGAGSIILYDAVVEKNVQIEALSLVMKGDIVPANTNWEGIPIRQKMA